MRGGELSSCAAGKEHCIYGISPIVIGYISWKALVAILGCPDFHIASVRNLLQMMELSRGAIQQMTCLQVFFIPLKGSGGGGGEAYRSYSVS